MAPSKWGEQVRPSWCRWAPSPAFHDDCDRVPGPSTGCAVRAALTGDDRPNTGPVDRPPLVVDQVGGVPVAVCAAEVSNWTYTLDR